MNNFSEQGPHGDEYDGEGEVMESQGNHDAIEDVSDGDDSELHADVDGASEVDEVDGVVDNFDNNAITLLDIINHFLTQEEAPEDDQPINFDTSLPSSHQYLGDVDLVPHIDFGDLVHGTTVTVPLFSFPHVVLFPGESLPLLLTELQQAEALRLLVGNKERLIGVANSHFKSDIITVAEIRYRKKASGSEEDDVLIVIGKERMVMKQVKRAGGLLVASGIIFEDAPTRIPMEARKNLAYWTKSIWKFYDVKVLMKQARKLAVFIEEGVNERTDNMTPTQYSFWLARNMPFQDSLRHALLEKPSTQDRLKMLIDLLQQFTRIACKNCENDLSTAANIINMSSEGSVGAYVNSHGYIHETLTVKRIARGVIMDHSPPSTEQSWFPGYAWTIMYCAGCFGHVGWRYDAEDDNAHPRVFWGLRRAALTFPAH